MYSYLRVIFVSITKSHDFLFIFFRVLNRLRLSHDSAPTNCPLYSKWGREGLRYVLPSGGQEHRKVFSFIS